MYIKEQIDEKYYMGLIVALMVRFGSVRFGSFFGSIGG